MPHKLLLADDSVTIQRVIELTFADEDVQVIAVGNGQDAIDRIQRDPPDIVLADAGMPERNGYEVAAFIKGQPKFAHIPVVLLTGAFEPVDEGRAKSAGCDGVLVKPFEPQLVISRVKDLLAGKRPSGMWGAAPVAQGPVRQAQPAEGAAPKGNTGGSLEAYFDHLDAAFASGSPQASPAATTAAPATSARSNDPFADWDPDLHGDPARPAPPPPVAFPQRASAPDPRPSSPAPTAIPPSQRPPIDFAQGKPASQAAPPPLAAPLPASLVDAFTALLEAEQKIGLKPSAAGMSSSTGGGATGPAVTEDLIEEVSRRVLARLTDQSRPVFLDVAERMVREEIERLRQS